MKTVPTVLLAGAAVAALVLTGCGRSDGTSVATAATSAPTPAAHAAAAAPAEGRAIAITANDTMKFDTTEIHARPGEALAVTLTNTGTVPKFSMGHNWVLLAAGTDLNAFTTAAAEAATTDYIPAAFNASVLARTKLLGPKESDTARFVAPTKPGRYPFLCAFPGHMQVGMKGDLIVE
ncbi:MAG TPA: plastocyanin/azurin family copper-binding protein [Opitutus sp.]|nr:plastocyanin/azurin family copper-binding protein [Opitutus sp.]